MTYIHQHAIFWVRKLLKRYGVQLLLFFAAIVAISLNVVGKNEYYCEGGKYVIDGSACWQVSPYKKVQLGSMSSAGTLTIVPLKIPYFLIESSSSGVDNTSSIVALRLKVRVKGTPFQQNTSASSLNLRIHHLNNTDGAKDMVDSIMASPMYLKKIEDKRLEFFHLSPIGIGFEYLIPRVQPKREIFFDCLRMCAMNSNYRHVSYELFLPQEWAGDYLELQKFVESFIDSIISN